MMSGASGIRLAFGLLAGFRNFEERQRNNIDARRRSLMARLHMKWRPEHRRFYFANAHLSIFLLDGK